MIPVVIRQLHSLTAVKPINEWNGDFSSVDSWVRKCKIQDGCVLSLVGQMKLCMVVAVLMSAIVAAQLGKPVDPTLERLAKVDTFAFGRVGYAGVTSQGEKDYKIILSRPSALADFEKLFTAGNAQAKSYALVGIRALSPERWKELLSKLRDSKDQVATESGCIVDHEPLGTVLKRIEAGDYSKRRWNLMD